MILAMAVLTAGVATVFTPTVDLPSKRTVVVLKDMGMKKGEFSKFFGFLESNMEVTYVTSDKKLALKTYEEYHYDNVIVFGNPSGKLGADFIDFVDHGGNIMIVANSDGKNPEAYLTDEMRTVAVDCGVEFSMNPVIDNFGENRRVIKSTKFIKSQPITGNHADLKSVVFQGVGLIVEEENPLVTPILSATSTSFVNDEEILSKVFGTNIQLVAGLQTRIGSRGTFAGSTSMFGNSNWGNNGEFVKRLTRWATQQHGILRYSNIDTVKLVDGKEVRDGEMYRIRTNIRFSITIEEFDGEKNEWIPFTPPSDDPVQVEYTMIDPYVRADLTPKGVVHTCDLQAPDVYGIFKFVVDYRRTGYNPLVVHHEAPVRPLKLNEYERFINAAFPYYIATFSAMGGFLLLGLTFLYSR